MKIKFNSDDKLPLHKMLKRYKMVIVVRSVFHQSKKYYSQVFLDEFLHRLQLKWNMLYYDEIDVDEDIDVNKTSASEEFIICCYWYFLEKGFKFQPYLCNGMCYDI